MDDISNQSESDKRLKIFLFDTYYTIKNKENLKDYFEYVDNSMSDMNINEFRNHRNCDEVICDLKGNTHQSKSYREETRIIRVNNTIMNENQLDSKLKPKDSCENVPDLKEKKHFKHFVAGALAGAVSRTLTAPLERLKILYQVNYRCTRIKPPSIVKGLKDVYTSDGISGLFRGNLINVTKATPDTAIKLYVFEKVKFYLKAVHGEKLSIDKLFLAGAIAGVTASFSVFPLDVIKTRLSAAPSGTYLGILDTMNKLCREGGMGIFYKGVEASICSAIPNSGLNLCCYELLKRLFSGSYASDNAQYLSTPTLMLTGGLSAMISSSLLYPLQTIQSRLIMQGLSKSDMHMIRFNAPYFYIGDDLIIKKKQSMITVIKSTMHKEGVRGFFKGYVPGITKIIIGNAISFGSYEKFKTFLKF